jgi:hypothetical protein
MFILYSNFVILAHNEIKSKKHAYTKKSFQKHQDTSCNQHELMIYEVDNFTRMVSTLGVACFFLTTNNTAAVQCQYFNSGLFLLRR